eukprot:2858863-Rhodomonas_salina.1
MCIRDSPPSLLPSFPPSLPPRDTVGYAQSLGTDGYRPRVVLTGMRGTNHLYGATTGRVGSYP